MIINADNPERVSRWDSYDVGPRAGAYPYSPQHQPLCEAAAAQTEVMDDRVQPRRASRRWNEHPFGEALREDLTPAQDGVTAEAASDH